MNTVLPPSSPIPPVVDAITTRRSIRCYQANRPIERDILLALLRLAGQAPSNFNRQPWQFVVLDTPLGVAKINTLLREGLAQIEQTPKAEELFHFLDHVKHWLYPLEGSAAMILAFYKPAPERVDALISDIMESGSVQAYNPNLVSMSMAIQNLLLAAHAHGLGACMHSGPLPFLRHKVNRLLGLPDKLELAGLISLGYPDTAVAAVHEPATPRKPVTKTSRFVTDAELLVGNNGDKHGG